MRALLFTLLVFALSQTGKQGNLAQAQTPQIVAVTDSTYRIDLVTQKEDEDAIDSTKVLAISYDLIQRQFAIEANYWEKARQAEKGARAMMRELKEKFGINYFVENPVGNFYDGTWVLRIDTSRQVLTFKNRRIEDTVKGNRVGVLRIRSQNAFETADLFTEDAVIVWRKVSDKLWLAEFEGQRLRLVRR